MSIIKRKNDEAEEKFKEWDLDNTITDKAVAEDVINALEEMFVKGVLAGGTDKDLVDDALSEQC